MNVESDGGQVSSLTSPATESFSSSRQQVSKFRKKVTTACESCKLRKVKCDGNQPCGRCVTKLLQCQYSAQEDRRVRSAEKRRIKQLEEDNQYLRDIIQGNPQNWFDGSQDDQRQGGDSIDDTSVATTSNHVNDDQMDAQVMRLGLGYDIERHHPPDAEITKQQDSARIVNRTSFLSPGATRSFGNLPFSSAITANHYPDADQKFQLRNVRWPDWQILPQWSTDESPLGRAYMEFLCFGKTYPAAVTPDTQLDLVDATLLFRKRRASEAIDADGWASELQRSFVEPITQTVNIAGTYMLARLMRWLLQPSPATYAAVPDMIKPSLLQRMRTHPAFIDTVAMPSLRNALLTNTRNVLDAIMVAGLDVSWPHSVNEALVYIRPKGCSEQEATENERVYISPQFAAHIDNPANWVFGRSILTEFPELIGGECSISQEDVIRPVDRWL